MSLVTAKGTATGTGAVLLSVSAIPGDLLIVVVTLGTTRTLTITWNGITMTQDVEANNASGAKLIICSLRVTVEATANVSATASLGSCSYMASAVSDSSSLGLDKTSSGTGNSGTPSSGATAALVNTYEICWGAVCNVIAAPQDGSWDGGFVTGQAMNTVTLNMAEAYLITPSLQARTASKTGMTSGQWSAAIAVYALNIPPDLGVTSKGIRPRAFAPGLAR